MKSPIDRALRAYQRLNPKPGIFARLFPGLALRRMKARIWLDQAARVYDAAKGSNYHVLPRGKGYSADAVMQNAGGTIRHWARHLDENHDLSIGLLNVLVDNIVGTGIMIEPMVMTKSGKAADKVNADIRKLLKEWGERPEVTGELPWGEVQRLTCRTWLRDGEILVQHVRGPRFQHYSRVPYSIELIEPDLLPFDPVIGRDRVVHGVEKNAWGQPLAYWLYKQHPGNSLVPYAALRTTDLRRVVADDLIHLKFTRRLRQTRGVSVFHGVIRRLDDIKDYEESERIAARVSASLTALIKKTGDFTGEAAATTGDRSFEMAPGMIFDKLLPGEDVSMVKSERPNTGLGEFVKTQLRALASGTGTGYSSVAKDYNGTYSAQRQEMVEQQPAYARLREYFIAVAIRRIYREFVTSVMLGGALKLPRGIDMDTLFEADMRGPGLPWIDPKKEAEADALAVGNRFTSRTQVIRNRGGDPDVIREQLKQEREHDEEDGVGPVTAGTGAAGAAGAGAAGSGDDAGADDESGDDGEDSADEDSAAA